MDSIIKLRTRLLVSEQRLECNVTTAFKAYVVVFALKLDKVFKKLNVLVFFEKPPPIEKNSE